MVTLKYDGIIFYSAGKSTNKNIRSAMSEILWEANSYDLILFYFSGHGFVDVYNTGYIAPYDMLREKPFVCGINMRELNYMLSTSLNKKNIVLILDVSYSGIAMKGFK